ncbi:MAG: type VI secretion system tube protein Hcp [Ideonella sp.]|nr:type VI secretion system tube protein Hcp [Ideonella sp.]
MPGNAFIKFEKDVDKGESTHETHSGEKGWIEISDWSWDIEADTSFLKGAGASVGKPQPGNLSFSHYYDKASPVIMLKIVQGKHFGKVHIVMLKQTGSADGKGEPYFGITMEEAFITKVSSKGAEDGSVTQDVEMVFKTVAVAYAPQELTGWGTCRSRRTLFGTLAR